MRKLQIVALFVLFIFLIGGCKFGSNSVDTVPETSIDGVRTVVVVEKEFEFSTEPANPSRFLESWGCVNIGNPKTFHAHGVVFRSQFLEKTNGSNEPLFLVCCINPRKSDDGKGVDQGVILGVNVNYKNSDVVVTTRNPNLHISHTGRVNYDACTTE